MKPKRKPVSAYPCDIRLPLSGFAFATEYDVHTTAEHIDGLGFGISLVQHTRGVRVYDYGVQVSVQGDGYGFVLREGMGVAQWFDVYLVGEVCPNAKGSVVAGYARLTTASSIFTLLVIVGICVGAWVLGNGWLGSGVTTTVAAANIGVVLAHRRGVLVRQLRASSYAIRRDAPTLRKTAR